LHTHLCIKIILVKIFIVSLGFSIYPEKEHLKQDAFLIKEFSSSMQSFNYV